MTALIFIRQNPVSLLAIYLFLINLALFLTMGTDKLKAKAHKHRVPEVTLFLLALLGGSIGGIGGMYLFRHKTRHRSFVIGFPVILALQLALGLWLLLR